MTYLRLCVIFLVFSLSACGTVERQAFNKEASAHIKTVTVTERTGEETYNVNILAHPGVNFGLIGGLIAAADLQSKTTRLTTALDPATTQLRQRFSAKLAASLATTGYQTTTIAVSKDIANDQVAASLPKLSSDALLVVSVDAAYIAAGPSSEYFPFVAVRVLKSDVKTGAKLYEDTITYGYSFPNTKAVHLPGDPAVHFNNMDDLVADPKKARDGLYAGVEAIVAQITADLKK